ncbi:ribosome maturation factor RimM [Parvimonas micra]|jgi:16S rRNA processing protein rimM|uniref:ribosome maturation factor RimM n=1 Tax=Parvimonas micra TaxID=33033 RepID=UPI001E3E4147|nr:ribosome maturation factor RimM [Parvimonas micra]MCE3019749.1 ribosome maturation factor RimM [Parvimonas micra]
MEFIEVAKIINVHGIKGTVKIYSLTSDINRFNANCKFYIDKNIEVTIKSVRKLTSELALLTFNEYDNINQVLEFKNKGLFIEESDLLELPDDEFYIYKLIGINVFDQNGKFIGQIKDVLTTLANDVYDIEYKGKSIYIPAVKEFVKEVDLDKSIMKVNIIDGILND